MGKSMLLRVYYAALLFLLTEVSRWRKASKCKRAIEEAQLRLAILKKRMNSIIRQSRADIAQLLQLGQQENALSRVKKVFKDQKILAAYDEINNCCECVLTNFSHICQQSDIRSLPIDVRQALANLIFAASRLGELPELRLFSHYFTGRYGRKFETANVQLGHGHFVSFQMRQNLCKYVVPIDQIVTLMSEIAEEHTFHPSTTTPLANKSDIQSCPFSWDSERKKTPSVVKNHHHSFHTSNHEELKDSPARLSHVHPKLPNYEDVVAKMRAIKEEHRRCAMSAAHVEEGDIQSCPFSWDSERKKTPSVVKNHHHSFHTSNHEELKDSPARLSHVHPKLPNYEDVVAKMRAIKEEHRRCAMSAAHVEEGTRDATEVGL